MKKAHILEAALRAYAPEKLDSSARGSGLNAVWKIRIGPRPAVLKTYASRRNPVDTVLAELSHRTAGRTGYSAAARRHTEFRNLAHWHEMGFDVPALIPHRFVPPLPLPWLCLEYVEGRTLANLLADPHVAPAEQEEIFSRFLRSWAGRHTAAEDRQDRSLIQEHPTIDHILVADNRLVTFDLEVGFTRGDVRALVAREIAGVLVSLFRRLPEPRATHFLAQFVAGYPDRTRIEFVAREFLKSPSPWRRVLHGLAARRARARGVRMHRAEIARRLATALRA